MTFREAILFALVGEPDGLSIDQITARVRGVFVELRPMEARQKVYDRLLAMKKAKLVKSVSRGVYAKADHLPAEQEVGKDGAG